jgi:hypothetical protein
MRLEYGKWIVSEEPYRREYVTTGVGFTRMTTCMKCRDSMPYPRPGMNVVCLTCREPWRRI